MAKILVVDDEEKIREMIYKYASYEGHEVTLASDGKKAVSIYAKEAFDVVILDVMMPELNGYETLKQMNEIRPTHCIFLTALGEEYDRVYGFDIGGEDYVTKPFSLKELMLRINVILKRSDVNHDLLKYKDLIIDKQARLVEINGKRINLSNKEYELLTYLLENEGKVVSRESIIVNIWGYDYDGDDRTLDTHMKLLRKDLGKYGKSIATVRGVGYRLEKQS